MLILHIEKPNLFAENVRQQLKENNVAIDYGSYIYGQLVAAVIKECLKLCNDLNLQKQLKKQNLTSKIELGQFCDQFAMDILISYSTKSPKKDKIEKNHISKKPK